MDLTIYSTMGFDGSCSRACSCMQQITLRSKQVLLRTSWELTPHSHRVLLACIKYLAKCPCPRCLIIKEDISDIGKRRDMINRTKCARVDDPTTQVRIAGARNAIFGGTSFSSQYIEAATGDRSLTAVRVCLVWEPRSSSDKPCRVLSRRAYMNKGLIITRCSYQIFCTNSKLACGRQHLSI